MKIVTTEKWNLVNHQNKKLMKEFFLELKQEGKSQNTLVTYEGNLKRFFIWVLEEHNNDFILDLKKKSFRNYSLYLQERGIATQTHNSCMVAIKSLLDRIEDDDDEYADYENNMCRKVKRLKIEPVKEIVFLTDEQVTRLYNFLISNKKYYIHALFLALAYESTGRRTEIYQVNKSVFQDHSRNNTNKVRKKGGKMEELIYFSKTKEAAKLYLEHRGKDDNPSLWGNKGSVKRKASTMNSLCDTMSLILSMLEGQQIHFSPHSLRHSAIENYTNGTHYMCPTKRIAYDITDIQKLASHASVSMTQSYKKNVGMASLESSFGIKIADAS